jgi:di/tricarboxylate transporter
MTIEIAILFLLIIAFVALLVSEKFSTDTLSFALMVVLIILGFVSPQEGISGLSNEAVVTILALMILTVGLETTGVVTLIGQKLKLLLRGNEWQTLLIVMLIVGTCSALISTTAVVIVFMRILIKLAEKLPLSLARLLIPLSFAGILGGSCTLLGTSTNLLVSAIAEENGLLAFSVFEFSHIGLILFITGIAFLAFIGRHLLPKHSQKNKHLTKQYTIQDFLAEVVVKEDSDFIGKKIHETPLFKEEEIDLIEIKRPGSPSHFPNEVEILQEGDILLIKASLEELAKIRQENDLELLSRQSSVNDERMNTEDMMLCEVIVRPISTLVGKSLDKTALKRDYDAIPLAVKKNRQLYIQGLQDLTIEAGDILLLEIGRFNFDKFYNLPEFIVLQEHEGLAAKTSKRKIAAAIMIAVILVASLEILPLLVSALIGCVAMLFTGCLTLQKAYSRVDWSVFFLLAGVIPLGVAMENAGASQWIADTFVQFFGEVPPRVLVFVLYGITTLLSAVISNNVTAILFAPIAISIAANLGIDPRPMLLTIMFAANMSFISPIGYQTNALVYSAGHYRVTDFLKVGGLLTLIMWILVTWLIPHFFF